jgi:hypothetical protein
MPRFLDTHALGGLSAATLKQLHEAPKDEFGVTHVNILYNEAENKAFCLLDAPSKDAVEKHHAKAGITTDWIVEVKTTA